MNSEYSSSIKENGRKLKILEKEIRVLQTEIKKNIKSKEYTKALQQIEVTKKKLNELKKFVESEQIPTKMTLKIALGIVLSMVGLFEAVDVYKNIIVPGNVKRKIKKEERDDLEKIKNDIDKETDTGKKDSGEVDISRYIDKNDGRFKRGSLALDVKRQNITHDELIAICNHPRVKKEFFGHDDYIEFNTPKKDWNEKYLDKLSAASVSECFTKKYLLFMERIAKTLHQKKHAKKEAIVGAAGLGTVLVGSKLLHTKKQIINHINKTFVKLTKLETDIRKVMSK